jgi:hypothetical protein
LNTKGKNSRGFYHSLGIKNLDTKGNHLPAVVSYSQKKCGLLKEKSNKKENSSNSNINTNFLNTNLKDTTGVDSSNEGGYVITNLILTNVNSCILPNKKGCSKN